VKLKPQQPAEMECELVYLTDKVLLSAGKRGSDMSTSAYVMMIKSS